MTYGAWRGPAGRDGAATLPEGQEGQVLGYDAEGNPIAVDLPTPGDALPDGQPGQVIGYDAEGKPAALDMPEGPQGEPGPKGDDGDDGPAGADGSDGASAYDIAVAEGFVGDEAAWLASLIGHDGADGVDGIDGADGQSATITVLTDEGDFDAYTPGPLELVVLTDA